MVFRIILFVWGSMIDLASIRGMGSDEKDLEILRLRQQLRIVERKQERGPQIPRWQKVPVLAELDIRSDFSPETRWSTMATLFQPIG